MADININANGCCNSKNFPKTQTSISWHSNKACKVTLSPVPNCFGSVSSITFPPYNQALQVQSTTTTLFHDALQEKRHLRHHLQQQAKEENPKSSGQEGCEESSRQEGRQEAPAKSKSKTAPKRTK